MYICTYYYILQYVHEHLLTESHQKFQGSVIVWYNQNSDGRQDGRLSPWDCHTIIGSQTGTGERVNDPKWAPV